MAAGLDLVAENEQLPSLTTFATWTEWTEHRDMAAVGSYDTKRTWPVARNGRRTKVQHKATAELVAAAAEAGHGRPSLPHGLSRSVGSHLELLFTRPPIQHSESGLDWPGDEASSSRSGYGAPALVSARERGARPYLSPKKNGKPYTLKDP